MLRIFSAIVFFLVTAAAATAAPPILVVGDSLSAGHGIGKEQSWPALLARRLPAEGYPHGVVNISISGETSSGGLSRLGPALQQYRPAIVVIALGANDGLRGLPLKQMRANLAAMIRQSQASRARVLLIGMQLPPNYGLAYGNGFQQTYADLAREFDTPLLPFLLEGFADRRDAFLADGLHPTAAMQPLILDNVWKPLRPLLSKR